MTQLAERIAPAFPTQISKPKRSPVNGGSDLTFPLVLRMPAGLRMEDEQFEAFCGQNEAYKFELNARGDLVIMTATMGDTGIKNAELTFQLIRWAKEEGNGKAFDSSSGFRLPNGALRVPDAAWMPRERYVPLTPEQRRRYLPLCPDFVVELRSSTDRLTPMKNKMKEYLANGARLGWLIDPVQRKIHVYRPDAPVEILKDPETVSGEPVLHGFVLDARAVFEATF